jgi:predicted DCC family thiol-disulfide oxidoreductase YuxK
MEWVLFFDGDCAFCSRAVRWVARRDRRGRICFAPLQGVLARQRGLSHFADAADGSLVVLRESDDLVFSRSDAWLELANALGGAWRIGTLLRLVPKGLRDGVYRWIGRHRREFPGRPDACAMPELEVLQRLRE